MELATEEQWRGFVELMASLETRDEKQQEDGLFAGFQDTKVVDPHEIRFDPPLRIELEEFWEDL